MQKDDINNDFYSSVNLANYVEESLEGQTKIKFPQTSSNDSATSNRQDNSRTVYQYKGKYIITSIKSGMVLINQHRAHIRILYEHFMTILKTGKCVSQRVLFPEIIELSYSEATYMQAIMPNLEQAGFEISHLGNTSYAIHGVPSELSDVNATSFLQKILSDELNAGTTNLEENIRHIIALSLANAAAIPYGKILSSEEMHEMLSKIFTLPQNKYTPEGKTILIMLEDDYLDKLFR